MSTVPVCVHSSRKACMNAVSGTQMPPTPWIPSTTTAHTSPRRSSLRMASTSFSGKYVVCPLALIGAMIFGLSVTSTASDVRPWNAFPNDTTRVRPLWNEANFSAFSFASAPELMRNN